MKLGIVKELAKNETRLGMSPEAAKRLIKKGFTIAVEGGAGINASFSDADFRSAGCSVEDRRQILQSPIVIGVNRLPENDILSLNANAVVIGLLTPYRSDGYFSKLAEKKITSVSMELIPRTSRAQAMDVLSSQANIAGYRAVIEAAAIYQRFFPMMMTSAGSSKPAKVAVLGVGVAGLQAISTAKRLGASVEAYDIRPEAREQILSVGAKVIEVEVGESGVGAGGYAKELSDEAKRKQQQILTDKLKKFDIIITTANVPGRKSPTLITEEAVRGMRTGSVVVDLAAANGGNCPLTKPDEVVDINGVKIIGWTNIPGMVASDASHFFGNNIVNLMGILAPEENKKPVLKIDMNDDIIKASVVTHQGQICLPNIK